jgi:hypothetical protein
MSMSSDEASSGGPQANGGVGHEEHALSVCQEIREMMKIVAVGVVMVVITTKTTSITIIIAHIRRSHPASCSFRQRARPCRISVFEI